MCPPYGDYALLVVMAVRCCAYCANSNGVNFSTLKHGD